MIRRSSLPFAVLAVLATMTALVTGCGGDDDGGTRPRGEGSSGGVDQPLEGTEWVLDQRSSRVGSVVRTAVVTAQFSSDGTLAGDGGCNRYNTTYTTAGSKMTIRGPIASTLMACAPSVMRVEQAYLARLPKATSFAIDGRELTIATSEGDPLVYRALDADEALAGDWVVINYFRPGAVVSPVAGSELTATFDAGRISGSSGCNQFSGSYEVDGTKIAIGPLASTLRACADPAVDQQSTEYLAALELARTFTTAGGNLTLLRDDGGIAVTFQRA